jgi:hypothetical protein
LRSVGAEFKVMQELLRHSSLRSTLDVYTQAITPSKQAAPDAVMSLVLSAKGLIDSDTNQSRMEIEKQTKSGGNCAVKGHKEDKNLSPFAPSLVSAHSV